MLRRLIVLGASGLAREMAMLVEQVNSREHRWELFGFIGDPSAEVGKHLGTAPILGDDDWLLSQDFESDLVIGIGYPQVRASVLAKYLEHGDRFTYPNLVHPSAVLDYRRVEFGQGNIIAAGCVFTCDIEVQDFNLFGVNTTVGHDARIGNFNVFNPSVNISGAVSIGDRVLAGTGCQVLQNLRVGSGSIIGAGAVVRQDVLDETMVVGIPAKAIPKRDSIG